MNRVIFGGSFDPFHSAHLAIVKKLHEFYNADVDILLSKTAHWKEATTSCAERIKMIELATNHLPYVNISTLEIDHNFPYTFLTIKHLREAYPKDKLYFCLGFDQVAKFHLWREPLFIAQNVKLVSFKRRIRSQDEAKAQENIKKYHIEVLDFPLMMVSSTKIRSFKSIEMPLPALEYLLSQKLYFAKHLSNFLVDNKYYHSTSVAITALLVAMSNKLPQPLYYFRAGLCHDIAKGVAPATIKQYLEANEASGEVLMEDQVLHQFYGAYLAKKEFNLTRGELEAIRYHTTGYKKMSPLMKVIYLVDKVEPLRKRDDDILHLAFKNYQAAFLEVVRRHEAALKQKLGKVSNIYTVSMIKSYLRSDVN